MYRYLKVSVRNSELDDCIRVPKPKWISDEYKEKLMLRNKGEKGQRCCKCNRDIKQEYLRLCITGNFQSDWCCTDCKKKYHLQDL